MKNDECRTGQSMHGHMIENNMLPQIGIVSKYLKHIMVCVSLMLMCHSSYAGDMPTYTRTDYPLTERAKFIFTGLVNRDEYPDVIVVGWNGALYVFTGGLGGVHRTPVITDSGVQSPILALADDFNNDGLTDICVNDTLFMTDGDGGFSTPRPMGIENYMSLSSGDMNRDGFRDILVVTSILELSTERRFEIRTYFGKGNGEFTAPVKTEIINDGTIDDSNVFLYTRDLTSDGIPDIVLLSEYSNHGNVYFQNPIYTGNSDGSFRNTSTNPGYKSAIIKVIDFNNDGYSDLVYGDIYGNVRVSLGDGLGGTIRSFLVIDTFYEKPARVFALVDINNDNILDVVTLRLVYDGNEFSLIEMRLGNGKGAFLEPYFLNVRLPFNYLDTNIVGGVTSGGMISAELNNDNCADFIISDLKETYFAIVLSNPLSTRTNSAEKSLSISISQNIPNPFNASTVIPYSIHKPGKYELAIYDILGRKIASLHNGFIRGGEYKTIWNGKSENRSDVASGFYFCVLRQIEGGNDRSSTKLLLLK